MTTTHGFTLLRDEQIAEYQTRARLYRHDKTGAELLSLSNHDENKVFGITFRTPPADSTGVAHILEHSVLCGSRKYPLKEPFVELLKGSLQTFLNAFTYPDKTCYPVASQNLKDFYNLIDIYMDAALHPLLSQATFDQEAWHFELDQADQPLIYKGVVFNEMKGVYASADSLLGEMSQRVLFPDITYGHDYGGDPRHIPDLTWEQLRAFHQRYYHPSNARIFFCGDDDPTERLRLMDDFLSEYDRADVTSAIPHQPANRPLTPEVRVPYPSGEEDAQVYLTVNWRLRDGSDPEHTLGLSLLDRILTDTPASPLRKALLESGLGEDLTGAGVETQLHEMFFSTGLKGVKPGDEPKVIDLIERTLASLVADGLDPKTIEAALNTAEFELRELNTGSFPRGLSMMIATLQTWLYDGDPLAPLRYQAPLDAIKARLARGERYFENLIRQSLLENPHRAVLLLEPDPSLKNRLDHDEARKLEAIKNAWTPQQIDEAVRRTAELKRLQATPDSPEALRTLPGLTRDDLERQNKHLPIEDASIGTTPFIFHNLFTQGITYLDVGLNLNVVPDALLSLVPIWATALLETGTAREDFVALSQRIGRETGGIRSDYFASAPALGTGESQTWLFLRGKATDARLDALLGILDDVFAAPRLDLQDRLKQIISEEKAELESDLIPAGHRYVAQRLRARFNLHDWVIEQTGGISFLKAVRAYATQVDRDWPALLDQLHTLHRLLTARPNLIINLTADASVRAAAEQLIAAFLDRRAPADAAPAPRENFRPGPTPPEGLLIPAQINYVGKSVNLLAPGERISGHALVVNRYIRSAWLWDQVRVQGGAYGGFSMIDPRSGQLVMTSYRDPNLAKTLAIYDRTGDYLQALDLDEDEVTRAVIGAIGDLDAYLLPDAKGYLALCRHLAGDTVENRQRLRDEVLTTTLEHFHAFGQQLQALRERGQVVVMGSAENLRALPDAIPTPVL